MPVELDKGFFEKLLRQNENDNSITLLQMESHKTQMLGNLTSELFKYAFTGTRNVKGHSTDYVKKLVVKVKPKDENHVHNFNCDVCFNNESNAYNVIVPILNQFASFPLAVPKHLYTDGSVVILEDLVERGFDGKQGCVALTPQQAESVLQVVANIHATSFIIKQKQPDLFDQLKCVEDTIFMMERDTPMLKKHAARINLGIEVMKLYKHIPEYNAINTMLHDFSRRNVMNLLRDLVQGSKNDKYSVISHGDLWMNNIFFKGDEVCLIDLQCMRCGSVALDLSYFLYVNLMPSVLEDNIDSLLVFYLTHLNECIKSTSVDMASELTIDWLQNEMEHFRFYGMVSGLFVFHAFYILDKVNVKQLLTVQQTVEIMPVEHKERYKDMLVSYVKHIS